MDGVLSSSRSGAHPRTRPRASCRPCARPQRSCATATLPRRADDDEEEPFPDNWIYIHDPGVRAGRVQNFGAWSPEMVVPGRRASASSTSASRATTSGRWATRRQSSSPPRDGAHRPDRPLPRDRRRQGACAEGLPDVDADYGRQAGDEQCDGQTFHRGRNPQEKGPAAEPRARQSSNRRRAPEDSFRQRSPLSSADTAPADARGPPSPRIRRLIISTNTEKPIAK